jgi:hypothetical protein
MAVTVVKELRDILDSIMRSVIFWVVQTDPDSSEEHISSVFSVEEKPGSACYVDFLAYSSILKIEALCSSETSVYVRILRSYNPEVHILQICSRPWRPIGCEKSRLPHFLTNRLTDVNEIDSLTCRPPFNPQEDSWFSFLLETEWTPGP